MRKIHHVPIKSRDIFHVLFLLKKVSDPKTDHDSKSDFPFYLPGKTVETPRYNVNSPSRFDMLCMQPKTELYMGFPF